MHVCRKLETKGFDLPVTLLDQSDEVLDYLSDKAPLWVKKNKEALKVFKPLRKQLNTMARMYNRTLFSPPEYKLGDEKNPPHSLNSPAVASAPSVVMSKSKEKNLQHERVKESSRMRKSISTP